MKCLQLYKYVNEYCGSCDYNWSLHNEYISKCLNGTQFLECTNICGLVQIKSWIPVLLIVLVVAIFLFILYILLPKGDTKIP